MGELTDIPHFRLFESALRLHRWESEKILIYLHYLMDENESQEPFMHIFKTLRKVLVERTCSISLSGLSIFLMGIVMVGHLHIYQHFNSIVLPEIISIYEEFKQILQHNEATTLSSESVNQFDMRVILKKQSFDEWVFHFSHQLLILLSKWLPKDFYDYSAPSVYAKIVVEKNIPDIQSNTDTYSGFQVYTPDVLKDIQDYIEGLNLGEEKYCDLCWKYQIMNCKVTDKGSLTDFFRKRVKNQGVDNNSSDNSVSKKLEDYRARKAQRDKAYKNKMKSIRRNQQNIVANSINNSIQPVSVINQSKNEKFTSQSVYQTGQKLLHDKYSSKCFFECQEFNLLTSREKIQFKFFLIDRQKNESLKSLFNWNIEEKVHKGIVKLKYFDSTHHAKIIQPKRQLKKHNIKQKYFLIDFQDRIKRIVIEFEQKRVVVPCGYLRMLQNHKINEWQAEKNKLRKVNFFMNFELCCNTAQIAFKLRLSEVQKKNIFLEDELYENFFTICSRIIKLTLKANKKNKGNVQVEGWCDGSIESIIILDELLSQIKFCFAQA